MEDCCRLRYPVPLRAATAAKLVADGTVDRAILICGTGLGLFGGKGGIEQQRTSIVLRERVVGLEVAKRLVREWIGYDFDPASPSKEKVDVILDLEDKFDD
ncbi:unnamed protein product [Parascedosporium putredinis]|uniref:Uncharacterized protein n=1 Tax=Parascedosporium putredinis TaxID=1442378 RepID=A0A9P1HD03_9PEZI|nr:unnamed protein product [Parascedosporium putredinis]CAI8004334.1 unnamed protein product [Parascedosporium putredinis]